MTIEERIFEFLVKQRGEAFCDDCVAAKLSLPQRQEARTVCATLGLCKEFERKTGTCVTPGHDRRLATRAL
jgi:hypothetical protein